MNPLAEFLLKIFYFIFYSIKIVVGPIIKTVIGLNANDKYQKMTIKQPEPMAFMSTYDPQHNLSKSEIEAALADILTVDEDVLENGADLTPAEAVVDRCSVCTIIELEDDMKNNRLRPVGNVFIIPKD
jgi:hypothetical protein